MKDNLLVLDGNNVHFDKGIRTAVPEAVDAAAKSFSSEVILQVLEEKPQLRGNLKKISGFFFRMLSSCFQHSLQPFFVPTDAMTILAAAEFYNQRSYMLSFEWA